MNQVFHDVQSAIDKALKRRDSPGDIIGALTACIVGVIECLKITPEIKLKITTQACEAIYKGVKK